MTEAQYHAYGLLAELLSVSTYRIEHMAAVQQALNFLLEARNEFESANQPKAEEAAETGPASENPGKKRSSKVRKQK